MRTTRSRPGRRELGLEPVQERLGVPDAAAVGAAVQLHLDQAQVDPHLDLVAAVSPLDDANLKLVGVVFPAGENGGVALAQATLSSSAFVRSCRFCSASNASTPRGGFGSAPTWPRSTA